MSKNSNLVTGAKRSSLTRYLRRSAKTNEGRIHVIPFNGMWGIKEEGKDILYKKYHTKSAALRNARKLAESSNATALVIHGRDGIVTSFSAIVH